MTKNAKKDKKDPPKKKSFQMDGRTDSPINGRGGTKEYTTQTDLKPHKKNGNNGISKV